MEPKIRPATATDVPDCVKILCDWTQETPWMPSHFVNPEMVNWWRGYFAAERAWVAVENTQIIGFCARDDDNIAALYVTKPFRSSGIGKRLLDAAKQDQTWITVWAYAENTEALRFYHREGLVEISREIDEDTDLLNIEHRWNRPT